MDVQKLFQFMPTYKISEDGDRILTKNDKMWEAIPVIDFSLIKNEKLYVFIDETGELEIKDGFYIKENIELIDYILMESFATVDLLMAWSKDNLMQKNINHQKLFDSFMNEKNNTNK